MRKSLTLAVMLTATPFAVSAETMSYRYAETGWSRLNISNDYLGDPNLDGAYIRGSYPITEQVYLTGSVNATSNKYRHYLYDYDYHDRYRARLDTTISQYEFGIGYHAPINKSLDFTAEASLVRLRSSVEGIRREITQSVNRGRGTLGLRGMPSARTEAWVKVGYMGGSEFDDWLIERDFGRGFTGSIGGQFKFTPNWSMVGEFETINDGNRYNLGVRASF